MYKNFDLRFFCHFKGVFIEIRQFKNLHKYSNYIFNMSTKTKPIRKKRR